MRYFLLLLLLSLSLTNYAQEEGWPIAENCLGELPSSTIPQEDWDFEGVIFNYNGEGVRAIRTDVETSYYIAFEDNKNFTMAGSFSPDGTWFVYPTGERTDGIRMDGSGSTWFIDGFSLVTTDPRNVRTEFAFPDYEYGTLVSEGSHSGYRNILYQIIWLNNETFVYFGASRRPIFEIDAPLILDINTGEYLPELVPDAHLIQEASTFFNGVWLPDASSIRTEFREYPSVMRHYNADNELVEIVLQAEYITGLALSPNAQDLAFFNDNRLQIANLANHSIEDLCLEVLGRGILWSPDGNYLAFLYDRYPILLNLETREMQILRYQTGSLMGWYPIAEE